MQTRLAKSQIKVLSAIYMATDCSNEVFDYAILHHRQERIADALPLLVTSAVGCVPVDGDGFAKASYRESRGFRLTQAGYEALTAIDPARWPAASRRFAGTRTAAERVAAEWNKQGPSPALGKPFSSGAKAT